jgi:hypothetical protein
MLKLISLIIINSLAGCAAFASAQSNQAPRGAYGPAITAHLTGLTENLSELEFQLRQNEISKTEYERTRQRLLIRRRVIEDYAQRTRADLVPEIEVLTPDEFGTLGLTALPLAEQLRIGAMLNNEWRVVGASPETAAKPARRAQRFYVFARLAQSASAELSPERKPHKPFDPLAVIETIVVPDAQPLAAPPPKTQQGQNEKPKEMP